MEPKESIVIDLSKTEHVVNINYCPNDSTFPVSIGLTLTATDKTLAYYETHIKPLSKIGLKLRKTDKKNYGYIYDPSTVNDFIIRSKNQSLTAEGVLINYKKCEYQSGGGYEIKFTITATQFNVAFGVKAMRNQKINSVLE